MTAEFKPDYAVHPGATIREMMDARGWSIADLASRVLLLEMSQVNNLVSGRSSIGIFEAMQLERAFKVPARFWMKRQSFYDETKARLLRESLAKSGATNDRED